VARDDIGDLLSSALTAPLLALGLDLEAVEVTPAGKRRLLRVAVDKDGGVTLDDVAEATKEVGRLLDDSDVMGSQPYTLEVSSPGIDRPLTHPRHWRRNAGRLVKLTTTTNETVTGRRRRFAYDDVGKAKVQVELNRKQTEADPDESED